MICCRNRLKCLLALVIIISWAFLLQLFIALSNRKYTSSTTSFKDLSLLAAEGYRLTAFRNDNTSTTTIRNECQVYPWTKPNGVFQLTIDDREYFRKIGNVFCFIDGTNFSLTNSTIGHCICQTDWHGNACSIPDSVWHSQLAKDQLKNIQPRVNKAPKKLIHAFPFNNEFELLDARLAEYHDVVDVFMILESNYTANGSAKSLHLLNRLKSGQFRRYACKIVHVFLDYFPAGAYTNGWIADDLLRNYLSEHGLKYQLKNYSSEDIFFMTDADELPRKDTVLFLKLHDGYPEPVGHYLTAHTFGFFWTSKKETLHIITTVSVGLLTQVLNNKASHIRSATAHLKKSPFLDSYLKAHEGKQIKLWSFGNSRSASGWHCSWCCWPSCIRTKLVSAQNGDFPRWGDYPEKTNLTYIKYLIKSGLWFDNTSHLVARKNTTRYYAPKYFLDNYDKYRYILENPYSKLNVSLPVLADNLRKTSSTI